MRGGLTPARRFILVLLALALAACGETADETQPGTTADVVADSSDAAAPLTEPAPTAPGSIAMRRLTEAQYRATIATVFGDDVVIAGRFEPDPRADGLLAVGAASVSVSPAGFEQYEKLAREVAAQVLAPERRARVLRCGESDAGCADGFIRSVGRSLYRRSLTDPEVTPRVELAAAAATSLGDFHRGLEMALVSLLVAPDFLFRVETAEGDLVSGSSLASRLSYFLWNGPPDAALLDAAADLHDPAVLEAQVDRMVASPLLEAGVAALFDDLYELDAIDAGTVRKDAAVYPAFSQTMLLEAKEQTLRTIVDHVVTRGGDYRELFTTRQTFMTRALGAIYQVPVAVTEGWQAFEFAADSPRAGVLGHVSLMATTGHAGRSSPTLRGAFIQETLLCRPIPSPPANIDFSAVENVNGGLPTARERLALHQESPSCAGCHELMDPLGLPLEIFDAIGMQRSTENGVPIDTSGELDGVVFDGPAGLGQALADNPRLGPCLVDKVFRYAFGRAAVAGEQDYVGYLVARFSGSGHRVVDLLRTVALSAAFRSTSGPREAEETP